MSETGHTFISYARRDGQPFVERLEGALQARGYTTWRDTRGIDPAKDFTAEIERAIKAADVIVTCITPDTERDDSFVRREIQYALVVGKRVIVARMAEVAPPIHVVNNTWVEFWRDWDKGFEHLITVLNTPVENYHTPSLPPETADPFRPYVQTLYERTVDFLDRALIRLIDLSAEETPEAVNAPPRQPSMIDLFFTAQGIGEKKQTKRLPFSTFGEAFNTYEGRVLLLGEPGAGKTITLMAFARDAAAKRLSDPTAPLPLLGLISSWDAEKQMPLAGWLASGVGGVNPTDVNREIERGKALLLLDGLDELGGEREDQITKAKYDPRQRFMAQLETLTPRFAASSSGIGALASGNRILVTCRVKDYEEIGQKIGLKGAVTLRPLDEGQMQSYLAEQPELWAAVQADAGLKDMLTTPLLLSFFAFAYRDDLDGTERQQLATFNNSPGDLRDKIFETYVQKRYEHEKRKYAARGEAMPFSLPTLREALGRAAMEIATHIPRQEITLNSGEIQKITNHKWFTFADFACSLGFLVKIQKYGYEPKFRFTHIFLRNHFVFDYCIPRIQDDSFYRLSMPDMVLYDLNPINALSQIRDPRIVEPIIELLSYPGWLVKEAAARVLGDMKDKRAIAALTNLLGDNNPDIRYAAVDALGNLEAALVVSQLAPLLEDTEKSYYSGRICDATAKALTRIGTPEALEAVRVWREQQAGGGE